MQSLDAESLEVRLQKVELFVPRRAVRARVTTNFDGVRSVKHALPP